MTILYPFQISLARAGVWLAGFGLGLAGDGVGLSVFERLSCSNTDESISCFVGLGFLFARLSLDLANLTFACAGLIWEGVDLVSLK